MQIDSETVNRHTKEYPLGDLIAEGKTKKIYEVKSNGSELVIVVSKDDITAEDGKKHDVIPGKGRLANETACNVFQLLKGHGLPVAFKEQDNVNSFIAHRCTMLPYEVVVRRQAYGSYLDRNPHLSKGHLFPLLLVEFFLKTRDKNWKGKPLVCDDPLMLCSIKTLGIKLFDPAQPIHGQEPFLTLPKIEVFRCEKEEEIFPDMRHIARQAFLILEEAWRLQGGTLVDFKVEFGFDSEGELRLADVVDNDSWRVLEDGVHVDKQLYRDGKALEDVAETYRRVAEITDRFLRSK